MSDKILGLATVIVSIPVVLFVPYPTERYPDPAAGALRGWTPSGSEPLGQIEKWLTEKGVELETSWPRKEIYHFDIELDSAEATEKFGEAPNAAH